MLKKKRNMNFKNKIDIQDEIKIIICLFYCTSNLFSLIKIEIIIDNAVTEFYSGLKTILYIEEKNVF